MNNEDLIIYEMFLDGKLSKEELRLKLKDFSDQDFNDLVEGLAMLPDGNTFSNAMSKLERSVDNRIAELNEPDRPSSDSNLYKKGEGKYLKWLIAATVLILAAMFSYEILNKGDLSDELFATYYLPLEHPDPVFRGEEDNNLEDQATAAYAAGDYAKAVEYYEELRYKGSWEVKNALFLGIAYLSINAQEKAINTFNDLPSDLGEYKDEIVWYMSLAHIKNNDLVSARLLLEKLSDEDNYYQEQANAILKKLK